jgi:hypothetical protein
MEFVALAWLVYGLTSSAVSLGLTGPAQALPRIVVVMLGGRSRIASINASSSSSCRPSLATLYIALATLLFFEVIRQLA